MTDQNIEESVSLKSFNAASRRTSTAMGATRKFAIPDLAAAAVLASAGIPGPQLAVSSPAVKSAALDALRSSFGGSARKASTRIGISGGDNSTVRRRSISPDPLSDDEDEVEDVGEEAGRARGTKRLASAIEPPSSSASAVSASTDRAEEKRIARIMANRRSAKESRERRKRLLVDLEASIARLTAQNKDLTSENDQLRAQIKAMLELDRGSCIGGVPPGVCPAPLAAATVASLPTVSNASTATSSAVARRADETEALLAQSRALVARKHQQQQHQQQLASLVLQRQHVQAQQQAALAQQRNAAATVAAQQQQQQPAAANPGASAGANPVIQRQIASLLLQNQQQAPPAVSTASLPATDPAATSAALASLLDNIRGANAGAGNGSGVNASIGGNGSLANAIGNGNLSVLAALLASVQQQP